MEKANKILSFKTRKGNRVDMELTEETEFLARSLSIPFDHVEAFWDNLSDEIEATTVTNLSDEFVVTVDAYYDEETDEAFLHALIERRA